VTKPKAELEQFLKEHGGIEVCGESERGPVYSLADRTTVAVPIDGNEFYWTPPADRPTVSP
jgi:hypothetical protein